MRAERIAVCQHCGNKFKHRQREQKFCSHSCGNSAREGRPPGQNITNAEYDDAYDGRPRVGKDELLKALLREHGGNRC